MPFNLITQYGRYRDSVLRPAGVGSRVVSCVAYMKGPLGGGFGYTGIVGQKVRLKRVKVEFSPDHWPDDNIYFGVMTGTNIPQSAADYRLWTNILPLIRNGEEDWNWMRAEDFRPFEWTMDQLFVGQGRRFGVYFTCGGTVTIMYLMVSFEISEG